MTTASTGLPSLTGVMRAEEPWHTSTHSPEPAPTPSEATMGLPLGCPLGSTGWIRSSLWPARAPTFWLATTSPTTLVINMARLR